MFLNYVFSKCKKIYQYGLHSSMRICMHRLLKWYFVTYWRKRIHRYVPIACAMPRVKTLVFVQDMCKKKDHTDCIVHAEEIVEGYVAILGSHKKKYDISPWHTDIRLAQQQSGADAHFDPQQFFSDIGIAAGHDKKSFTKDIKVPWELSRVQHLPILGHAYMHAKNERYAKEIIHHISGWIQNNPFLLGVNWVNPMEVGLRAVSIIVALSMIEESAHCTLTFKEKVASSMKEHLVFIEHNFEWYDGKTSNHYLSDLVGYLYLSWFFDDTKKCVWVIDELERELHKQILSDGTSYEGSTRYHQLVTELVYYAYLLIDQVFNDRALFFAQKIKHMNDFLWWCTPHTDYTRANLIAIGDDDSGRVSLFEYMFHKPIQTLEVKKRYNYFKQFGLSVYKTQKVHTTLRHHAYRVRQPTGHFHNDVASITLAVRGIPIIVDPGSFVYTPSVPWRNYFRSVAVHNTSYPYGIEPNVLSDNLFFLDLCERKNIDTLFYAQQHQYQDRGLYFERKVTCSDAQIVLHDAWHVARTDHSIQKVCWNFTLHPRIQVKKEGNRIEFIHDALHIATIESPDLSFELHRAFCSPSYGKKQQTNCIRVYAPCDTIKATMTIEF